MTSGSSCLSVWPFLLHTWHCLTPSTSSILSICTSRRKQGQKDQKSLILSPIFPLLTFPESHSMHLACTQLVKTVSHDHAHLHWPLYCSPHIRILLERRGGRNSCLYKEIQRIHSWVSCVSRNSVLDLFFTLSPLIPLVISFSLMFN